MLVSVHLAEVGARRAASVMRTRLDDVPGLTYSQLAGNAPLGQRVPLPRPGRVGLIAAWEEEGALDEFLESHPLAEKVASGWHARLQPVRTVGHWPGMPWLPREDNPPAANEPAAVLTLGRFRWKRLIPFIRASRQAEVLVKSDPAVEFATALARPPFVATFSLWKTTDAMRGYATGRYAPGHRDAMQAHAANPFHHESAFVRFRPLAIVGR